MSQSNARQFLLLVRHGESHSNKKLSEESDGLYYSTAGSDQSVGLTDDGRRQSRSVADRVKEALPAGSSIDIVWRNRFERVRVSADLLIEELGIQPEVREDGRIEKRSYGEFWNLTYRGVRELHPAEYELFLQQGAIDYRPPGGENYHDLFERVGEFIADSVSRQPGNHLVVTSSAVVLAVRRLLAFLPDEEVVRQYEAVALANGHVDVYVREGDGAWQLISDKLA